MTAHRAVAMNDNPDRGSALPVNGAEAGIAVKDGDHVPEPQTAQSIALADVVVEQLNVVIAAPGAVLAQAGTHDGGGYCMGDGRLERAVLFAQSPTLEQGRGTVKRRDFGMIQQAQTQAAGTDLDTVADLQAFEHLGREIHQDMIDAAVFAGHQTPLASTRAADHLGAVADAGVSQQRLIGAVAWTYDLALVVVQGYSRLDVVSRQPHATISYPLIEHDAPGGGQHARYTILADAVEVGPADGMGDLPGHHHHHEVGLIDTRMISAKQSSSAHKRVTLKADTKKLGHIAIN